MAGTFSPRSGGSAGAARRFGESTRRRRWRMRHRRARRSEPGAWRFRPPGERLGLGGPTRRRWRRKGRSGRLSGDGFGLAAEAGGDDQERPGQLSEEIVRHAFGAIGLRQFAGGHVEGAGKNNQERAGGG